MSANMKKSAGGGNSVGAGGATARVSVAPLTEMRLFTRQAENQELAAEEELNKFKKQREGIRDALRRKRGTTHNGRLLPYIMSCLVILFSLIFLVPRVLWGGFYATAGHGTVIVLSVILAGVCALCLLLMLIFRRRFVRAGLFVLCLVLFAASVCVAWTLKNATGNNDYLAVIILAGLAMFFCVIVCVRRYVMKRTPGSSHRVLVFAAALLLLVSAVLPLLPIGAKTDTSFVQGGLLARNVRYERCADGHAALTRVMLNADDLLNADKGAELAVCDTVTLEGTEVSVTAVAADAFAGVRGVCAVRLPESVVRIEAGAFRESDVKRLHASAPVLHLADGLAASGIGEIYLEYAGIVQIDGAMLRDGITLRVPADALAAYENQYPAWVGRILPI